MVRFTGKQRSFWYSVGCGVGIATLSLFFEHSALACPGVACIAQGIPAELDALPPPPPVTFGQDPLPPSPAGSRELEFNAPLVEPTNYPPPASSYTANPAQVQSLDRHLVYVNGSSELLLNQVRQVEPGAFRQNFKGREVIQVGIFQSKENAEVIAQQLAAQGILTDIEFLQGTEPRFSPTPNPGIATGPVPSTSPNPYAANPYAANPYAANPYAANPYGQPVAPGGVGYGANPVPTASTVPSKTYYVAIPGDSSQNPEIYSQIAQAGIFNIPIQSRLSNRGPFIAVGPFPNRDAASMIEQRLQSVGLGNARIYYGY